MWLNDYLNIDNAVSQFELFVKSIQRLQVGNGQPDLFPRHLIAESGHDVFSSVRIFHLTSGAVMNFTKPGFRCPVVQRYGKTLAEAVEIQFGQFLSHQWPAPVRVFTMTDHAMCLIQHGASTDRIAVFASIEWISCGADLFVTTG